MALRGCLADGLSGNKMTAATGITGELLTGNTRARERAQEMHFVTSNNSALLLAEEHACRRGQRVLQGPDWLASLYSGLSFLLSHTILSVLLTLSSCLSLSAILFCAPPSRALSSPSDSLWQKTVHLIWGEKNFLLTAFDCKYCEEDEKDDEDDEEERMRMILFHLHCSLSLCVFVFLCSVQYNATLESITA